MKGGQKSWTLDQIKAGFEYFYEIHKRYPTTHEMDDFKYLPTSRALMKKDGWGGLPNVRKLLGISNYHMNKGAGASKARKRHGEDNRKAELDMYNFLVSKFGILHIHEQEPILKKPNIVSPDFVLYLGEERKVAIDVFTSQHLRNVSTHIHLKNKKYISSPIPVFYVLYSNALTQKELDKLINNRISIKPKHIKLVTEDIFKVLANSNKL